MIVKFELDWKGNKWYRELRFIKKIWEAAYDTTSTIKETLIRVGKRDVRILTVNNMFVCVAEFPKQL